MSEAGLRTALEKIACFNDGGANAHLAATGSYGKFDEPAAVKDAREALEANPVERRCRIIYSPEDVLGQGPMPRSAWIDAWATLRRTESSARQLQARLMLGCRNAKAASAKRSRMEMSDIEYKIYLEEALKRTQRRRARFRAQGLTHLGKPYKNPNLARFQSPAP